MATKTNKNDLPTKETPPVNDEKLIGIDLDKLHNLYPEAAEAYYAALELISGLRAELNSKPGAEARGLAWTYLHKLEIDNGGEVQLCSTVVSSRSDVDANTARYNLEIAIREARADGYYPYKPRIEFNNRTAETNQPVGEQEPPREFIPQAGINDTLEL
jgi:hypothetical protein